MNDNVISEMGMTGGDMGLGKKIDLESLFYLCLACLPYISVRYGWIYNLEFNG